MCVGASFNGWILPWPEKPPHQSVNVSTSPHRSGRMTHYLLPSLQHERKGQIFSRSHFLNKHGLDTRHRACDTVRCWLQEFSSAKTTHWVRPAGCLLLWLWRRADNLIRGRGAVWSSLVNVHSGILQFSLQLLQAEWSTNPLKVFKSVFSLSFFLKESFFIFFISFSVLYTVGSCVKNL